MKAEDCFVDEGHPVKINHVTSFQLKIKTCFITVCDEK